MLNVTVFLGHKGKPGATPHALPRMDNLCLLRPSTRPPCPERALQPDSRDLDSRLNSREAAAVTAWFSTPHHFHFMRDHPAHSIEILGSGWGARLGPSGSMVRKLFRESFHEASHDPMFWADRKAYGPDQGFLKRYIWPWGKWSSLSHDSFSCKQFPRTSPFPTRRKDGENNFIAAVGCSSS